jgi:Fe-S cluster assembly protein SufD
MGKMVSEDEEAAVRARMPHYDSADPYKLPALMPSSADRSIRSFDPDDFPAPGHRSDEWRYAPIDRLDDFFHPFTPSGLTEVSAAFEDGTPVAGPVRFGRADAGSCPAGSVGKPVDKASAVQWQASAGAGRIWWLDVTSPSSSASQATATAWMPSISW